MFSYFIFPYDYVYFKAGQKILEVGGYLYKFPYDYVYFKATYFRDG